MAVPIRPEPTTTSSLPAWAVVAERASSVGAATKAKETSTLDATSATPVPSSVRETVSDDAVAARASVTQQTEVLVALAASTGQMTPSLKAIVGVSWPEPPRSRCPLTQRVRPPATEPAACERVSMYGDAAVVGIRNAEGSVAVATAVPPPASPSADTTTVHRVPAAVRALVAAPVTHASVPVVELEEATAHVASDVPPPSVRVTAIRAASSVKPSPRKTSATPPAALPSAVPPPVVMALAFAMLLSTSTPLTATPAGTLA